MRLNSLAPLVLLLMFACNTIPEREAPARLKGVKCAPVTTESLRDSIEVRGTIAPLPERDAQVAPQVSGRIVRVEVQEGDMVVLGQVIARVDDATLTDMAHQADAALTRARGERQNAETAFARIQRVFEHGIAARQELDDASARAQSTKGTEAESVAISRQAHRQIDRAIVRSPLKGVVLKVLRKPGELVDGTPGTAIAEIADISELELVADVPAQDLVRLVRGSAATVTFPAIPGKNFVASVARVAPSVDRTTGVGGVRIGIQFVGQSPPPVGTFGIAHIETGGLHSTTLVPSVAIRSVVGGEGQVIVCGTDHVAHVQKVRPGSTHDGRVEVHGELVPTDRVAVDPVLGLADGDAIEDHL